MANIPTMFSAILYYLKSITSELLPLELFSTVFLELLFTILALIFPLTLLMSFIVTLYLPSNYFD